MRHVESAPRRVCRPGVSFCTIIAHPVHQFGLECDGVDAVGMETFANAFRLRHEIRQGGVVRYDVR
jgi:hypothetical protein